MHARTHANTNIQHPFVPSKYTDMRRLNTGILPEKCVVRRFRRRANVIECK